MIVSASTLPLTTKHHKAVVERHQPAHAKPRGVSTTGSVAIHHDTHEKEAPKTPAQRIAALGTGVLLTTSVNLLVNAENKLSPSAQPKSAALLSTDVGSWVKSLGLLAGVQGINAGLGLHLPPAINALELGAVSHVLIPGTTGSRVAHFMTMAPLLIGSVGVTQAAHAVIDHTVDSDSGLNKNEKQVTKSLLGFVVSIGMGVAAMALFPRIHIGLSGLDVKFQSHKATGAKALENWYITTTKTVDGWQHATGKAWEQVQTKLQNRWERTWKKTAERPPLNKETWFDKKAFIKNVEVPWVDKAFYTEKPEDKLYTLQKSHSQTLEVLPEPYTWQEHTMQWLTGKQSSVARAMLATKWGKNGTPVPSRQFLKGGEFEQFHGKYQTDMMHLMDTSKPVITRRVGLSTRLENGPTNGLIPRIYELSEALNNWLLEQAETITFSENKSVNQAIMNLLVATQEHNHQLRTDNLSTDLTIIKERYLPLAKKLDALNLDYSTIIAHLKSQGRNDSEATDIQKKIELLHTTLIHIEGHIPAVSSFWAMTGAAAGAVTCGSGCCAGSFFCLNEATALFGSLFGALVTKLGLNQSKESKKKKQKAKV